MKWEQSLNSKRVWIAQGALGTFYIRKLGALYYAKYSGDEKEFMLPAQRSIRMAKQMCEENFYWEDEKK